MNSCTRYFSRQPEVIAVGNFARDPKDDVVGLNWPSPVPFDPYPATISPFSTAHFSEMNSSIGLVLESATARTSRPDFKLMPNASPIGPDSCPFSEPVLPMVSTDLHSGETTSILLFPESLT